MLSVGPVTHRFSPSQDVRIRREPAASVIYVTDNAPATCLKSRPAGGRRKRAGKPVFLLAGLSPVISRCAGAAALLAVRRCHQSPTLRGLPWSPSRLGN
jgi:hypothetical protein